MNSIGLYLSHQILIFNYILKDPVDSCFINNYFIAGIKGFLLPMLTCSLFLIIISASHMHAHILLKMKLSVPKLSWMPLKKQKLLT